MSLFFFHHTGTAHHTVPCRAIRAVCHCHRHTHPGDHHSSSLRIQRCLRCIQIQTVIHIAVGIRQLQFTGLRIKFCQGPDGLIRIFLFSRCQTHRAAEEDPLIILYKQIRTLDRPAVRSGSALIGICPVFSVFARIKENSSGVMIRTSHHHIIAVSVFPHLRVSHLRLSDLFIMDSRQHLLFVPVIKMEPIFRYDHCLARLNGIVQHTVNIFRVWFQIFYRTIINLQLTIFFQRGTGEHTILIVFLGREQGDPLMLPVHQILADRMSPVHGSPFRCMWKMLEKQVIFAFIIDKTVRIVDPVPRGFYMYKIFHLRSFLSFGR